MDIAVDFGKKTAFKNIRLDTKYIYMIGYQTLKVHLLQKIPLPKVILWQNVKFHLEFVARFEKKPYSDHW